MPPMLTVREEPEVQTVIDAAIAKYPRLDELWDGWKWRLSRDPTRDAVPLGSPPVAYIVKTADLTAYGLPTGMAILFTISDTEVNIVALKLPE